MRSQLLIGFALSLLSISPRALAAQVTLADITRVIRVSSAIIDVTGVGRSRTTSRSSGRTVSSRVARRAVDSGDEYVGVPYLWGGSTPRGFDCSGFVQYVYRENGVDLPRTSRQMAHAGVGLPVDVHSLREGDLMLFSGRNGEIDHVALYAGGNQILHSSSSGHGVKYDDLGSNRGAYFVSHFVAARRVTENGRSLVESVAVLTRRYPFDHFDRPDLAPSSH
jgi:cell wall-associated NlpC family hydrolase